MADLQAPHGSLIDRQEDSDGWIMQTRSDGVRWQKDDGASVCIAKRLFWDLFDRSLTLNEGHLVSSHDSLEEAKAAYEVYVLIGSTKL